MLIYSMTVSADGFISDRDGDISWSPPTDELFDVHLARVRELGGHLIGRRLYETMLVWETDPSVRSTPAFAEFADVWTALPKVVFSRGPLEVQGNARRATASLAEEYRVLQDRTDRDLEIGGASLAGQALELDLVDELRIFRAPVVLGAGTPYFPPLGATRRLELIESRTFEPGIVSERYRVAHDGSQTNR